MVAAALSSPAVGAPKADGAGVPVSFFGVVPQADLQPHDYARIGRLGVTLRIGVHWSEIERQRGQFDFAPLDRLVAEAGRRGVRLLPVIYGSPAWAASEPARPPLRGAAARSWRRFLITVVRRYGGAAAGAEARVGAPIRIWQVWNEPNFRLFWKPRPSARGYARLLRASARAIRTVDPRATIVAAGVAPVESGMRPYAFMRRLYRTAGAADSFDVAALHPYSTTLPMLVSQVRRMRYEMRLGGDGRKPLLISELGVASGPRYRSPFDLGLSGQARFLARAYRALLRNRQHWRIAGAYWFSWRDLGGFDPHCAFCPYSGLLDVAGEPKPAWYAFRRLAGAATRSVR